MVLCGYCVALSRNNLTSIYDSTLMDVKFFDVSDCKFYGVVGNIIVSGLGQLTWNIKVIMYDIVNLLA